MPSQAPLAADDRGAPGSSPDAVAQQAQVDATTVYNSLAALSPTTLLIDQDLSGMTRGVGVYRHANSTQLAGTLTIDFVGA